MNQNLVGTVLNKNVYLVNDRNISFYICLPKEDKVTMVLNLVDDTNEINISNNNPLDVKNKVTDIYSKFNNNNTAVVTPVVDNNIMEQIKLNAKPEYLSYLNKVLGYLINVTYRYLKNNGKEVYEQIKLNNNENYKQFNEKFISMYQNRVELVTYGDAPVNRFDNTNEIENKNSKEDALANTTTISLDDAYKEIEQEKTEPKKLVKTKEPGFVSYVLLGVIVAVISLVILYLLL